MPALIRAVDQGFATWVPPGRRAAVGAALLATPLRMLAGATAYWWGEERATGGWVSAYVRTAAPAAGVLVSGLQRTTHGDHRWLQPTARWGSPPADGIYGMGLMCGFAPWGGCPGAVCCEGVRSGLATEF